MPLITPAEPAQRITRLLEQGPRPPASARTSPAAARGPVAGPGQLPGGRLRGVLRDAQRAYDLMWPAGPQDDGLRLLIAAFAVPPLPPGLYQAGGQDPALRPVPAARARISELAPRWPGCDGLLLVCGDVRRAAAGGTPGGYGGLLVRAGALAHLLCGAAAAAGLAGPADPASSAAVTSAVREADAGLRHLLTVSIRERGSDNA